MSAGSQVQADTAPDEPIDYTETMLAAIKAADEEKAKAEKAAADKAAELAAQQLADRQADDMADLQDEAEEENAERDALAASLAVMAAQNATAQPIALPPPPDTYEAPKGSFGPTFMSELATAGLATAPIVISPGHIMFAPEITVADRAAIVALAEEHDPTKELPQIFSVAKIDVYRQLTPGEYNDLVAKVGTQPPLIQGIYNTAINFVSDSPEYGLLMQMATELYGEARAKALLGQQSEAARASASAG